MEAKHTPGPWKWDGNVCDCDPSNEAPWIVAGALDEVPVLTGEIKCDNEANARLMVAAPDLLEALKALLFVAKAELADPEDCGSVHAAEAAICKATGAQS